MGEQAGDEPLEALRVRLEATQRAAERLMREAAEFSSGEPAPPDSAQVPPAGWEAPPAPAQAGSELQALAAVLETLRAQLPEDIQRQVSEIVRQLLLLIRALIDWWIARMDRDPPGRELPVQDIPIA